MEKLLEILQEIKPGIDFEKEDDLIENKILDSLQIMSLVMELSNEFDITITPIEIVPENFKSIHTISALIERLQDED